MHFVCICDTISRRLVRRCEHMFFKLLATPRISGTGSDLFDALSNGPQGRRRITVKHHFQKSVGRDSFFESGTWVGLTAIASSHRGTETAFLSGASANENSGYRPLGSEF